jgi:hypothetical protein
MIMLLILINEGMIKIMIRIRSRMFILDRSGAAGFFPARVAG